MRMRILVITKYTRAQFSLAVVHANQNILVYEFLLFACIIFLVSSRWNRTCQKKLAFQKLAISTDVYHMMYREFRFQLFT